jgi:N-acetyl-anhydromuramyl-L-alanine amidase AmpD
MKTISPAEWVRKVCRVPEGISDDELNRAAMVPDESVYSPMEGVSSIILHHSATVDGSVAVFRSLHRAVNGWVDIGYHYVIGNGTLTEDGSIEKGRPDWAVGAHARGHNEASIGICLVGDFTETSPTEAQMASLNRLVADLKNRLGPGPIKVMQHREMPGCRTECPGIDLAGMLVDRN